MNQINSASSAVMASSEMQSAFDSLSNEICILRDYIGALESKLTPVLNPTGEGKQSGSSPSSISPEAPMLAQLRSARSQVMNMSERLEKLRDNLVV